MGIRNKRRKPEYLAINTESSPNIRINNKTIKAEISAKHLGTIKNSQGNDEDEIRHKCGKIIGSLKTNGKTMWRNKQLYRSTKAYTYKSIARSQLTYNAEIGVPNNKQFRKN